MLSTTLKKRDKIQYQQGLEQGLEQSSIIIRKTACALLLKNLPVKEISEITGLSIPEIENLK